VSNCSKVAVYVKICWVIKFDNGLQLLVDRVTFFWGGPAIAAFNCSVTISLEPCSCIIFLTSLRRVGWDIETRLLNALWQSVLPTGIFLCQVSEIWHFLEVVAINIFGLAYFDIFFNDPYFLRWKMLNLNKNDQNGYFYQVLVASFGKNLATLIPMLLFVRGRSCWTWWNTFPHRIGNRGWLQPLRHTAPIQVVSK